jgi:hypothetical protein
MAVRHCRYSWLNPIRDYAQLYQCLRLIPGFVVLVVLSYETISQST